MKNKIYRIILKENFDAYGRVTKSYYTIKESVKLFGLTSWATMTEYLYDTSKPLVFNTLQEAERFVEDLKNEKITVRQGSKYTIVKEIIA